MYKGKKVSIIIGAAGSGKRMGGTLPKQFLQIGGKTILEMTLDAFAEIPQVDNIIMVVSEPYLDITNHLIEKYLGSDKTIRVVIGGKERQDSIYNGIKALSMEGEDGIVLIHDGARPYVHRGTIMDVISKVHNFGAAIAAVPAKDTIKQMDGFAEGKGKTLDRGSLYHVQTPQGFTLGLIRKAHEKAFEENYYGTDDASLVERLGYSVMVAEGTYDNIKITTKEDMPMEVKVGTGFDVHKLVENRQLILGGVQIPYEKGLLGHSDADVMVHAFMDALLGAAGLGDIGKHFPDSDDEYKDISSIELLRRVNKIISDEGYRLGNGDITIIAQRPKIASYIPAMKENIARAMGVDPWKINIKGTTTEKLGFTGRGEGIAAEAVCLLEK